MSFWENYEFLCHGIGKSPTGVGVELGINRAVVSAWKNKNRMPRGDVLADIARYFNTTAEMLVCGTIEDMFFVGTEDYDLGEPIKTNAVRVPILGRVAAGIPIEQIVDIDGWEEISDELAKNGKYFALKIHGNSMEPRMCEKDTIIVRQQNSVENGEIAVVSVNGLDATCKKIEYTDEGISLVSFNPAYAPMKFTKEQAKQLPITILGKVVELRAKM